MTNGNYFGDEMMPMADDGAHSGRLARRQFVFSLAIGVLLLTFAALIASQPSLFAGSRVGLHKSKVAAPEIIDANPTAAVFEPRG